ncbi:aquaporin-12-like [Amphiura filiformis]|uniref:aquaporin-12-like n=1 Tax=Amphiura filiformis TaxID=82378 RepID=UPI003B2272D0
MAANVIPPALATPLFVFLSTELCEVARFICRRVVPKDYYIYAAEFIATFQLVAGIMEGDIILEEFGTVWYGLYLWLLFMSESITFDGGATASVCTIWQDVFAKEPGSSVSHGLVVTVSQVLGGQLAFPYVKRLWQTSPTSRHGNKWAYLLKHHCDSALKATILGGCFAEALATFTYYFACLYKPKGRMGEMMSDSLIQVIIILIGLEWTGMMFNPALASALTFNCRDHPFIEHFTVYWIAPLLTIAAMEFFRRRLRKRRFKSD